MDTQEFLDTKISLRELCNWHLHWAVVDIEFELLHKPALFEKVVALVQRVRADRLRLIQSINTIYDYPNGFDKEIRALPNWQTLENAINLAIAACKERELKAFTAQLETKLG